jgi:hypothetical protein
VLDMPDNITVSPIGQIYACEDGLEGNFLRRITLDGRVIPFARNAVSWSEFAGVCFSLDGSTLFVNIQHDGLTLAVRGPFKEDAARDLERSSVPPHDPHTWNEGLFGLGGGLAVIALAALARRRKVAGTPP